MTAASKCSNLCPSNMELRMSVAGKKDKEQYHFPPRLYLALFELLATTNELMTTSRCQESLLGLDVMPL